MSGTSYLLRWNGSEGQPCSYPNRGVAIQNISIEKKRRKESSSYSSKENPCSGQRWSQLETSIEAWGNPMPSEGPLDLSSLPGFSPWQEACMNTWCCWGSCLGSFSRNSCNLGGEYVGCLWLIELSILLLATGSRCRPRVRR
jgi:hypothetical protein